MAPSFKLYAFIALFELGLAYPNAILRYAGFKVYYLREFIIAAVLLSLALAWSVILCEKINERALVILITLLSFAVFIGGIPEIVGLLIMASLVVAALPSKNVLGSHSFFGALYFFVIAVLAVTTDAGVYIGLPFMQEKLEFVIVFASLVYALSVFKSFERINISNKNPVALFITALILVSVVVSSTYFPTPSCSETNNEFVIWSYNIHQGFTIYGAFNGHDLAKLIAENSPAIIAMQEVDGGRITSAYQDIPVIISAYTGMCYAYQPAIENTYGVAVFSIYPILSSEGYLLESIGEQRASIKVTLKIGGGSLILISVHLGLTPEERLMQADELLKFSVKDPQAQIVAGDFNAEVDEESIKKMLLYYNDSFQKRPEYTWHWKEERESIDYVFIKKDAKLEIKSAGILETLVSDHIPVWVRIKLF
ncbi:MAG: endonuclease/exonuclease/phosphatase family protein [Thermococcus sp.]|uniref:endonuclease/exonuclease/phosphatase family protein n=1 Tax=Thermococcus sp. TaxID=35749 RepID=UPI001E007A77|nr:endonuclease/exonuclease/phosphatase family protein [Thermococcus sp.]MBO8173910.1 endonuclease/exonuclease/phosphatase family protein [Thermococcus sp.]